MLNELKRGTLVIVNDLLGFVKDILSDKIILNTSDGPKTVSCKAPIVVMAQPEEVVTSIISNLRKVVIKT